MSRWCLTSPSQSCVALHLKLQTGGDHDEEISFNYDAVCCFI